MISQLIIKIIKKTKSKKSKAKSFILKFPKQINVNLTHCNTKQQLNKYIPNFSSFSNLTNSAYPPPKIVGRSFES
jgi:hypothetical protein